MINKTKAAIADLEKFTDAIVADKKTKVKDMSEPLSKPLKADVQPSMQAPQEAGVASFVQGEKPADNGEPMVSSDCWDEAPKDAHQFSCEQQRDWGKCGEGFMVTADAPQHGYCAKTCGRC